MWLKEENNQLVPPPVNYRTPDGWIMNFNLNQTAMTANGWRDWSEEEIAVWKEAHPGPEPPGQTVFTKLSIRRAMRELGIETKLDNLLNASAQFRSDWQDAQDIDLTDPVLIAALQAGTVTAQEIAEIKRIAGGSHE